MHYTCMHVGKLLTLASTPTTAHITFEKMLFVVGQTGLCLISLIHITGRLNLFDIGQA